MDKQQKKKRTKIIIILLAVLLGISVTALAGTLIYNHFAGKQQSSVVVPANIITPEAEESKSDGTSSSEDETQRNTQDVSTTEESAAIGSIDSQNADELATVLSLYDRNSGDNTPFAAGNMFPGDEKTKYYCVRVSYRDTVVVRFHANIRGGYEKLSEVLKCRIVLLATGETMYDGLMRDMPESINHKLTTTEKTTSELYYEISAYLDTSVGDEYMEKDLIADFKWWVEEVENLESPQTGDDSNMALWSYLALGSLFVLILLFKKRRKEDEYEH